MLQNKVPQLQAIIIIQNFRIYGLAVRKQRVVKTGEDDDSRSRAGAHKKIVVHASFFWLDWHGESNILNAFVETHFSLIHEIF